MSDPIKNEVYLAVDCGASSSRVMSIERGAGGLEIDEIHRFPTPFFERDGQCFWEVGKIVEGIETGLAAAVKRFGAGIRSIGIDTWGVDYVLVDAEGRPLQEPFQYRDDRTSGLEGEMDSRMGPAERFAATGVQDQFFNTLNQVVADKVRGEDLLGKAESFLFVPDYLSFCLCGKRANEFTIASTAQLLEAGTARYSEAVFKAFGLSRDPFQEVVEPGTVLGPLTPEVAKRTGARPELAVVAVGSHDTASAFAGAPLMREDTVFLSSGTWSLLGVERSSPVLTEEARTRGFSNEGGAEQTTRLLKNIVGLWMIQECVRAWKEDGQDPSYAELDEASAREPGCAILLSLDHEPFFKPGGMPEKIEAFCRQTGQAVPQGPGATIRAIQDSLALTYRQAVGDLEQITGSRYEAINVVGGGAQSDLLNQLTADLSGRTVHAGPVEAAAVGNALMQMKAAGVVGSLAEGRAVVADSVELKTFKPREVENLEEIVQRHAGVCGKG